MRKQPSISDILLAVFLLSSLGLIAQAGSPVDEPCYQPLRNEGVELLQADSNYAEAMKRFIAARFCPDKPAQDDLAYWIQKTQNTWVAELDSARQRAEDALKIAVDRQRQIEVLFEKEQKAREEADNALAQAKAAKNRADSLARWAEANRLALLSEYARREGRVEEALYLAYQALRSLGSFYSVPIWQAFGEAVYAARAETVLHAGQDILDVQCLSSGADVALTLANSVLLLREGTAKDSIVPPGQGMGIRSVAVSADGQRLLISTTGRMAGRYDLRNGRPEWKNLHTSIVLGGVFAEGTPTALTWSRDNLAIVWKEDAATLPLRGHEGFVYAGQFAPDGWVLTRSADGTARLWDPSGALRQTLGHDGYYLYSAVFSPTGETILTAATDSIARLWNRQGELLQRLSGHTGPVKEAVYSPDGEFLLTHALDPAARLWDATGRFRAALSHEADLLGARFSPDGASILTWAMDGSTRLWDTKGTRQMEVRLPSGPILYATFSHSSRWILTTSQDGNGRLWDRQGNLLMTLPLSTTFPLPPRFSPDDRFILSVKGGRELIRCPVPAALFPTLTFSPDWEQGMKTKYSVLEF